MWSLEQYKSATLTVTIGDNYWWIQIALSSMWKQTNPQMLINRVYYQMYRLMNLSSLFLINQVMLYSKGAYWVCDANRNQMNWPYSLRCLIWDYNLNQNVLNIFFKKNKLNKEVFLKNQNFKINPAEWDLKIEGRARMRFEKIQAFPFYFRPIMEMKIELLSTKWLKWKLFIFIFIL